jgi:nitrate/nitrite-specific signal transduction histidine kinase
MPVTRRLASLRLRWAHFRPGLSVKLLGVVVVIAFLNILASSWLLLSWLQQELIQQAEETVTHLNLPLRASLDHAMLTHDLPMLNTIIQEVAADLGGERIWLMDAAGSVRASSDPADVGRSLARSAPECQACHIAGASSSTLQRTVIRSEAGGMPALLSASPIANEPSCAGCHAADGQTLGLILIRAPLADLNRQLQDAAWRVALGAGVAFAVLVGLLMVALRRFIIAPMGELAKGVAAIGSEDLDYRLHIGRGDEFGALANAFDAMRSQLKASRLEMQQRNQELAVLYEVALVTGQLLELRQILELALDTVIGRLDLEVGIIYLWDEARRRFETVCSRGLSSWQLQLIDEKRRQPGGDLTSDVAQSGEVFFVPDITQDAHFVGTYDNPSRRSYVNIPLKSQGKVVGTLELVSHAEQPMTRRQVDILAAAGHQIGIAIDHTALLLDTRRTAHEALTLYQLGTTITATLDLNERLEAVAQAAREALTGDLGLVALLDAERNALVVKAMAGPTWTEWSGLRLSLDEAGAQALAEPARLEELPANLPRALAQRLAEESVQSMLMVPLQRGGHVQGILAVLMRTPRAFTEDGQRLLTRLAQQVVVAIENARLYQQVRYLAVLEERDRLAREMHDNLAQTLSYLNLKTSLTSELLANGEAEQAQAGLAEMKQITRAAYSDTREAIFHLRNAVWQGADLVPLLRDYLAEYRAHYGLDAQLIVEDAAAADFSREVSAQLSRIIQEALTNVRKHAQATQTWIRFEPDGDQTRVVIQDNGRGFDLTAARADGQEHFGLQIMRERAAGVGGTVEYGTQPGFGTRVIVRVPRQTGK